MLLRFKSSDMSPVGLHTNTQILAIKRRLISDMKNDFRNILYMIIFVIFFVMETSYGWN